MDDPYFEVKRELHFLDIVDIKETADSDRILSWVSINLRLNGTYVELTQKEKV